MAAIECVAVLGGRSHAAPPRQAAGALLNDGSLASIQRHLRLSVWWPHSLIWDPDMAWLYTCIKARNSKHQG